MTNTTNKVAHTYKELMEIAGNWSTASIKNDYIAGADRFTLNYLGESVSYQNDDPKNVAGCALNYNGMSQSEYCRYTNTLA